MIYHNKYEYFDILQQDGYFIDVKDSKGNTPLHIKIKKYSEEKTVDLEDFNKILSYNPNIYLINNDDENILDLLTTYSLELPKIIKINKNKFESEKIKILISDLRNENTNLKNEIKELKEKIENIGVRDYDSYGSGVY